MVRSKWSSNSFQCTSPVLCFCTTFYLLVGQIFCLFNWSVAFGFSHTFDSSGGIWIYTWIWVESDILYASYRWQLRYVKLSQTVKLYSNDCLAKAVTWPWGLNVLLNIIEGSGPFITMPTASSLLEPLIHTYVPASRTDESLKHDLISHCQEILRRYGGLDVKFRNKSNIMKAI